MRFPYPNMDWDVESITPTSAAQMLRSLPGRYSELLEQVAEADRPGILRRMDWTANALSMIDQALVTVLVHDNPPVILPQADPEGVVVGDTDHAAQHLEEVANATADHIAGTVPDQWARPAESASGELTFLDLVRSAVFVAQRQYDHLRVLGGAGEGAEGGEGGDGGEGGEGGQT